MKYAFNSVILTKNIKRYKFSSKSEFFKNNLIRFVNINTFIIVIETLNEII